ncbi:MAG TPA: hypothetical protein VMM13_18355, partial [Euzebya sp.]|nr:hypothetical protein [Euzebya sp.]
LVDRLGTGDVVDGFHGSDMPNTTRSTEQLPNLDLSFRVARQAGFVKVRQGKVAPTRRAADLDARPEQAWPRLAAGLVNVGILDHRYARQVYLVPPWIEELDSALPQLLAVLYLADGPVQIDDLVDIAREDLEDTWHLEPPEDDVGGWSWWRVVEDNVRLQLRRLAEAGICTVADVEHIVARFGVERAVGGTVELTAGGRLVTAELLRREGVTVPEAGRLKELDAPALLRALSDADPPEVAAEVMVWADARDPAEGFGRLVDAVVGRPAELPLTVVAAALFAAAAAVGVTDAEPGMRRLLQDRLLAPVAGGWLAEEGFDVPQIDALDGVVTMAALGLGDEAVIGLQAAGAADVQRAMIETARGDRGQQAVPLLQAIADLHPDKIVTKAARKALFRLGVRG